MSADGDLKTIAHYIRYAFAHPEHKWPGLSGECRRELDEATVRLGETIDSLALRLQAAERNIDTLQRLARSQTLSEATTTERTTDERSNSPSGQA